MKATVVLAQCVKMSLMRTGRCALCFSDLHLNRTLWHSHWLGTQKADSTCHSHSKNIQNMNGLNWTRTRQHNVRDDTHRILMPLSGEYIRRTMLQILRKKIWPSVIITQFTVVVGLTSFSNNSNPQNSLHGIRFYVLWNERSLEQHFIAVRTVQQQ